MTKALVILLLICSACLIYAIYLFKKKQINAESLSLSNERLKIQINQSEHNFKNISEQLNSSNLNSKERETNLYETISKLQKSLDTEQRSIEERNHTLKSKEKEQSVIISDLQLKLSEETQNRKKILSQKKSGEVRLGHVAETLAPFLDQFDFDPESCSFLGQPIDYISFGEDEITFIEVKSGNSQLSSKQRFIRDQVKSKLISWKEVRIK